MPTAVLQCPAYEISREDFRRPFSKFVSEVFHHNPDLAMFKVIPPKGWSPRVEPGLEEWLDQQEIQTPIKQHVFGTRGTYRCILVEQKAMKVKDFRALAESGDHLPPKKAHDDDNLMERSFWSSITINPPIYGADNPMSLFDRKLRFGWNLRNLGDLLQTPGLDSIPGVTTPMVYFGMWKSFFNWHTEDCDLYSTNYLHAGASKIWYCVPPLHRAKFEAMARKEFPELFSNCKGFLRHKDIMFSPTMLRMHNVPYVQTKQNPGEFVVLNCGAYHAGFNLGFNYAEAINFALPDWIPVGRKAVHCSCESMRDRVCIDMRFFCPDLSSSEEHDAQECEQSQSETPAAADYPESAEATSALAGRKRNRPARCPAGGSKRRKPASSVRGDRKHSTPLQPQGKTPEAGRAARARATRGSSLGRRRRRPAASGSASSRLTSAARAAGVPPPAVTSQGGKSARSKLAGRATATSARALGKRSLRSTNPNLPDPKMELDKALSRLRARRGAPRSSDDAAVDPHESSARAGSCDAAAPLAEAAPLPVPLQEPSGGLREEPPAIGPGPIPTAEAAGHPQQLPDAVQAVGPPAGCAGRGSEEPLGGAGDHGGEGAALSGSAAGCSQDCPGGGTGTGDRASGLLLAA